MVSYTVAFLVALACAAVLTPVVRLLSHKLTLLDLPNARKVHRGAIPRTGGIPIVVAFLVPVAGIALTNAQVGAAVYRNAEYVVGITVGGVMILVVGLLDDLKGLGAKKKFLLQILVATFAYACGFRIEAVSLPFVGVVEMGVWSYVATLLWIIGIVNALNLIDGLDGLAAGIGFFVLVFNFIVGYVNGSVFICLIAASLAGAILGFLFYNFNPASIFMGDGGSMFIGYVLALGAINSGQKCSTTVALLTPIAAMGIPIMDTLFSMVRRFLERRSIFSPDKGHIHHKLLDRGLPQKVVVAVLYGGTIALILAASLLHFGENWQIGVGLLVMVAMFFLFAKLVGMMDYFSRRRRSRLGLWTRHTQLLRESMKEAFGRAKAVKGEKGLEAFLSWYVEANELKFADVYVSGRKEPVLKVTNGSYNGDCREPLLQVESQLLNRRGKEFGYVRFGWHSERGRVSSATEILFQVVCDRLAKEVEAVFVQRRD